MYYLKTEKPIPSKAIEILWFLPQITEQYSSEVKNKTKQVKTNGTVDRGITEPAELAEPTKPREMTVFIDNGFRGIRFGIKKKDI